MFKIYFYLKNIIRRNYNKFLFRNVNSNINRIVIGPDIDFDFVIKYPRNLTIGDGTVINGKCLINAFGGVDIGSYCHIAKGLTIFSHNHNYKSDKFIPYDDSNIKRSVTIGDAVWIGADVNITPGSVIGNGAIISSGSVVFGEVPECAIVRGNPAVVIKYRDKKVFTRLYNQKKFK